MAVYLSPIGNDQTIDSNGNPLVGGFWEVFLAGTTTPVTTYTSNTGLTPQAASIVLDASGRTANPIWITGGVPVKFRLSSAASVVLLTIDNVSGINDPSNIGAVNEWVQYGAAPTYVSATSFSVAGDQTNTFQIGRRLKSTNTGGTRYSTITNSVYGSLTTVTVTNDSGTLDSGLSAVSYGLLSAINPSVPATYAKSGANTDITSLSAPALGAATATTAAGGTNTTQVATTAMVQAAIPLSTAITGVKRIAQIQSTQTGAVNTGTTLIPNDDSIPQITEGDEYMTVAITPTSAGSTLEVEVSIMVTSSVLTWVTAALFRDSTANALAAAQVYGVTTTTGGFITFKHRVSASSTSATTFRVRAGGADAGTMTFNGSSTARRLGGVMASSITVTEVLA